MLLNWKENMCRNDLSSRIWLSQRYYSVATVLSSLIWNLSAVLTDWSGAPGISILPWESPLKPVSCGSIRPSWVTSRRPVRYNWCSIVKRLHKVLDAAGFQVCKSAFVHWTDVMSSASTTADSWNMVYLKCGLRISWSLHCPSFIKHNL